MKFCKSYFIFKPISNKKYFCETSFVPSFMSFVVQKKTLLVFHFPKVYLYISSQTKHIIFVKI